MRDRGMTGRRIGLALLFAIGAGSVRAAAPLPLADFLRPSLVGAMTMSPNGKYVAGVVPDKDHRMALVVIDLAELGQSRMVAAFSDADVRWVWWVNDDRLVFDLTNHDVDASRQRGQGLWAVPRDGAAAPRRLIKNAWEFLVRSTGGPDRALDVRHRLLQVPQDGTDDVLVEEFRWSASGEPDGTALLRLDAKTGRSHSVSEGAPDHVFEWGIDRQGVARTALAHWRGIDHLYWRAGVDAPWQSIAEGKTYSAEAGVPAPLFIGGDDSLYVETRSRGADTSSLGRMRVEGQGHLGAPQALVSLAGYDFSGTPIFGPSGELLGVHYLTDAQATLWFDPGMQKLQARIEALLPQTINLIECGRCSERKTLLVTSWSDRQPTVYRLYDVATDTLSDLASARPWIAPAAMAHADMVRISARDGLPIPVHVTRPNAPAGPLPTVVLVHGGPFVRGGEWGWEPYVQLLASRGYLVIEPEFRGSAGFGNRLFRAGFKQWGLAMQDDVADAAVWAVQQGSADPQRICIAGASYGGYATLMGLARNPEIFRCGFEWVGVTDIDLMYSDSWSDASDMWKEYGMPAMVGDRVKDAAQLAATSPIRLAAKIRQPLLMAYGGVDRRVPAIHGIRFRDAVSVTNPNVEWVEYPGEGHGWMLEANDIDFWSRVERFLDKNLKAPAP